MALRSQKPRPGHHILDRIHNAIEDFQVLQAHKRGLQIDGYRMGKGRTKLEDGSTGWKEWKLKQWCRIDLVWTPGHEGIKGNELADGAAKLTAKGETSDKVKLPYFLRRKQLPISISATRQTLKKNLKTRWTSEWTLSPRFPQLNAIDASLPSDDYLHIIDQLTRRQASLLTQLRTTHIPLNLVLHRIKRADTPFCPHCPTEIRETIPHLLFFCPHYDRARALLQAQIGYDSFDMQHLMSSRAGIPHLLNFINNTCRLRATFGEVSTPDGFVIKEKERKERRPSKQPEEE